MSSRLKQAARRLALVLAAALVAAPLARPARTDPPVDARRAIRARAGVPRELIAVVDRACDDRHSDAAAWPWYTRVAPLAWLMAGGVARGRRVVHLSAWASYPPAVQRGPPTASCDDASRGDTPMRRYVLLHPEATLPPRDVPTIRAAAGRRARTGSGRRFAVMSRASWPRSAPAQPCPNEEES